IAKFRGTPRLKRCVLACCRGKLVSLTPKWLRSGAPVCCGAATCLDRGCSLDRQHDRTLDTAVAQPGERRIRLLERKDLDLGAHRDAVRKREEFRTVPSGQVGDRSHHPLTPQEVI